MKQQNMVQTLKGFRDIMPEEKRRRDYVMVKIIKIFNLYGFEPLETPTLEYASLLLGKYGKEADKLVYSFTDRGGRKIGLRYDQTVPTARVLAQYQNQLPPFFRRYQIQNVFRADKPQKGRFREFTHCDIDIFNSNSPLADAEILACTYDAFKNIGFKNIVLNINDRQLLFSTLKPFATEVVDVFSIIQTIDKLDKLSPSEVVNELKNKGLEEKSAKKILVKIGSIQISSNLKEVMKMAISLGVDKKSLKFTPSLARGLDYYTGMIFEIIIPEFSVGSCAGGGRYNNLINSLSGVNVPAVGVAFGFDRIVEAASQLDLIPTSNQGTKVLVTIFNEKTLSASLQIATKLRQAGISTEIYPQIDKIAKQFKYANRKKIPFVAIIGEDEIANDKIAIKNMKSGEQRSLTIDGAIEKLKTFPLQ